MLKFLPPGVKNFKIFPPAGGRGKKFHHIYFFLKELYNFYIQIFLKKSKIIIISALEFLIIINGFPQFCSFINQCYNILINFFLLVSLEIQLKF